MFTLTPGPAGATPARPDVGIVSVVHCETPCGTVNDVGAIAARRPSRSAR